MVPCIYDSIKGTVRLGDRTRLRAKDHREPLGEFMTFTWRVQAVDEVAAGWCMWWHRLEMSPVRCQRTDLAWSGQHLEGHPLIKSVSGRVSYQTGTGRAARAQAPSLSKTCRKVQAGDVSAEIQSHTTLVTFRFAAKNRAKFPFEFMLQRALNNLSA